MNTDSPEVSSDDAVALAVRTALAQTIAHAPSASLDWNVVRARARRTVLVRRAVAVSTCLVVAFAIALVSTSHSSRRGVTVVNPDASTTISTVPSVHPVVNADALAFRVVQGSVPFGTSTSSPTSTCAGGRIVTPPSRQRAAAQVVLADRRHTACYELGPVVLTGQHVSRLEVQVNSTTSEWEIDATFDNDDFVQKVAVPYVHQEVAMVVDGIVESAPIINPGITGNDVTISGNFDQATAVQVAHLIMPVGVKVDPPPKPTPADLQLQEFERRCAAVAPRLGLGSRSATSMVTVTTARSAFERAHVPVPASLSGMEGSLRLAMCEGEESSPTGVTPTSVCPNGAAVDTAPLVLYAVDAKLQITRLPPLQYLVQAIAPRATIPSFPC